MTTENNTLGELTMVPVGAELSGPPDTVGLETNEAATEQAVEKKKPGRKPGQKAATASIANDLTVAESINRVAAHVDSEDGDVAVLGVFALNAGALLPEMATSGSGAFDIRANLQDVKEIVVYTASNKKSTTAVRDQYGNLSVILQPRTRAMIPTGLIFDIPAGFKLELSARSGLSLKEGLNLANGQALIDSDYVEETFILIQNNSDLRVEIKHGDRIAQAALARVEPTTIVELTQRPAQKTTRAGGMGSTGVQ